MTSVERIQQYNKLPNEPPHYVPDTKPPEGWPAHGKIKFDNISFAHYYKGPLVLRDISLDIRSKEKVCICCDVFIHNYINHRALDWHCWANWGWKKFTNFLFVSVK